MGSKHRRHLRQGSKNGALAKASAAEPAPVPTVEKGKKYRLRVVESEDDGQVEEVEFGGVRLQVVREKHYEIRTHAEEIAQTMKVVGEALEITVLRVAFTVWVLWLTIEKLGKLF